MIDGDVGGVCERMEVEDVTVAGGIVAVSSSDARGTELNGGAVARRSGVENPGFELNI